MARRSGTKARSLRSGALGHRLLPPRWAWASLGPVRSSLGTTAGAALHFSMPRFGSPWPRRYRDGMSAQVIPFPARGRFAWPPAGPACDMCDEMEELVGIELEQPSGRSLRGWRCVSCLEVSDGSV